MRHDIVLEGAAFRLRPVHDGDIPFIIKLRNNIKLNQFLHSTSDKPEDQRAWLLDYYLRPGDFYFAVESIHSGITEGLVSIYGVDNIKSEGEWGRWILKPKSLAAVESAWLIYKCAFEILMLNEVYCRTVASNFSVVSFHDSCNIANRTILSAHFKLGGKVADAIEHRVNLQEWGALNLQLGALSKSIARRLIND